MPPKPHEDTDWGMLGKMLGSGMETAGNIPWLQALGQGAGGALDWADVSGEEYLEAPWYQRAAAGAIDPGGTIAETGLMAAGVTDPDALMKAKMMGGMVSPDMSPGMSPAMVGGAIRGGSPTIRKIGADRIKAAKKYPGIEAPLRRSALNDPHTLTETLPKGGDPAVRGQYTGPYKTKDMDYLGKIAVKRGGPNVPSTFDHEGILHRVYAKFGARDIAKMEEVTKQYGRHPRIGGGADTLARDANESFTHTAQQILDGQTVTAHPAMEDAVRQIMGEVDPPSKGLLSDFADSNIPLMELEMDSLLRNIGPK